ncbi:uncharacterized protein Z520_12170 [Fonsecaea multimorphosa CBS 102226]|uniref:Uncharacterized protein n=1 Tax=Fonsecaea multimorphosa CBS 102226 TaxID=1442371 RepID=A0A0D2I444_9EURO|nr:uncharacterized protein Z520_12170 [Fonsecaea multimorphosa CBS 102226]KIX92086.1 hypothetical protein Z520_12170 [Fonsecaea multimorphosa CBS 102226]OAL17452.1 hypothetical protein AYO22_11584 [Fonsecaea multimorphosa]
MSMSYQSSLPDSWMTDFLESLVPTHDESSTNPIPRGGLAVPPRLPPRGGEPGSQYETDFRIQVLNVVEERGARQFRELVQQRAEDDAVLVRRGRTCPYEVRERRECEDASFARFHRDVEAERTILRDKHNALEQRRPRMLFPLPGYRWKPHRDPNCRTGEVGVLKRSPSHEDDASSLAVEPIPSPSPGEDAALSLAVESMPSPSPDAPVIRKRSQEQDDVPVTQVKHEDMSDAEVDLSDIPEEASQETTTARTATAAAENILQTPRTATAAAEDIPQTPSTATAAAEDIPQTPGPGRARTPAVSPCQMAREASRSCAPTPSRTRRARADALPPFSMTLRPRRPRTWARRRSGTGEEDNPGQRGPTGPKISEPRSSRAKYVRVSEGRISVMVPALDVNITQIYHESGQRFSRRANQCIIKATKTGSKHNGCYVSLERAIFSCRYRGLHRVVSELEQLRSLYCPDSPLTIPTAMPSMDPTVSVEVSR